MGDLLILAIWEINTQKNMNFGYPNDPVMKYLIRAAIYTSRLYVWLRNYKLRIFLTWLWREVHRQWIFWNIGKADWNRK